METNPISRRSLLQGVGALGLLTTIERRLPSYARASATGAASQQPLALSGNTIDLTIAETPFRVGNRTGRAVTINGTVPGPLIRLREGQDVTLRVTNRLRETSSIHWHGILLPPEMDGVPGVSFAGIKANSTFTYRFPIKQYGTYWYHSHSGGQEQKGMYAPMIIDPREPDPIEYDREYVVVLSDWTFQSGVGIIGDLKKQAGFFNFQQRTMREFFSDLSKYGWKATWDNYLMWAHMRMDPTDFADVTGYTYTYLMNGLSPEANWTGVFRPGERVRLRFINSGSMTFFDVRIPGLKLTVVQADGQNVHPVEVDEFRMGPAETYDVVVVLAAERAYTVFAEALDRSGYARGTLAPRAGMSAAVPERRPRALRTMEEMSMSMEGEMPGMALEMDKNVQAGGRPMSGMDHGAGAGASGHQTHASVPPSSAQPTPTPQQHDMKNMEGAGGRSVIPGTRPVPHGPDKHGSANQAVPDSTRSRLDDPGTGLGGSGRRVLVYTDLRALEKFYDTREPERELELHATGHMERFIWSFDGKKFSQAPQPIHFRHGERLRWTFVNDTMMEHTFHLHGMWMHLENGARELLPRKHTVIVKPAERVSVAVTADAPGHWAFHCHLLLHMETGMFRIVEVSARATGGQS